MKKIIHFMPFFCILLISCAVSRETMQQNITGYTLPVKPNSESALVYVVRPENVGMLVKFNVFLDDKNESSEMGYTRGNEYIYFNVKPGSCNIFSEAENWADLSLKNVKAGDTIFIMQEVNMGLLYARNSLKIIDEVEGKYYVKNAKQGTVLKEKKSVSNAKDAKS